MSPQYWWTSLANYILLISYGKPSRFKVEENPSKNFFTQWKKIVSYIINKRVYKTIKRERLHVVRIYLAVSPGAAMRTVPIAMANLKKSLIRFDNLLCF